MLRKIIKIDEEKCNIKSVKVVRMEVPCCGGCAPDPIGSVST